MKPDNQLTDRYNVPGPRYTSYPTAVQFSKLESGEMEGICRSVSQPAMDGRRRNISLYFHIPFCFSLCWYCGCTKVITRDSDRGDHYLGYLEKEMDLLLQHMDPGRSVVQIHFGGGTPTFLRPDQILRLGSAISTRFNLDENVEFSVEIDPRSCDKERIGALQTIGCNRASLGVQDTNPEVQAAIHRVQPYEQTATVTSLLRQVGIQQINFDLMYGLPRQTVATFRQTLSDVMNLNPDRLAVYSYAHMPHLMPSQKLLNESEFPSSREKLEMIDMAAGILPRNGMRFIGMDHFAKIGDSLSEALDEGTLQRNFQGYSTCADTDMIAFGMSGISQLDSVYYQNTKDLGSYYRALDRGELPLVNRLYLSTDDRIRREVIMQIMCRTSIVFSEFNRKWAIDFRSRFADELGRLKELEADGLVICFDDRVEITSQGHYFLRNIAMVFDGYLDLHKNEKRFSKTI